MPHLSILPNRTGLRSRLSMNIMRNIRREPSTPYANMVPCICALHVAGPERILGQWEVGLIFCGIALFLVYDGLRERSVGEVEMEVRSE